MGGAHTREALSPPVSGSPLMKCGAAVLYASISDMQVLCCAYLRAECRKMESSSKLQTANCKLGYCGSETKRASQR